MTVSPSVYKETGRARMVGTSPVSPPCSPYHIVARQGFLQANPADPCPDNQQCTWCTTYLHVDECPYKQGHLRCDCFNHARLPARFQEATIEKLQSHNLGPDCSPSITRATQWLLKWCNTLPFPQKGLVLSGTPGTGKSFAMAAMVRHLTLAYERDALFLDFQQFIRELKCCYHNKDNEYELFDKLRQKKVLVLDDVQPTRDSPWIREVLHTIIAQRYNDCSTTFLTTNLAMSTDMKDWVTPHTYSRLKQMCYWLLFHGPDRRELEK